MQFSNNSFSKFPSVDESVPWTSLRLSQTMRYHESVRAFEAMNLSQRKWMGCLEDSGVVRSARLRTVSLNTATTM